MIVYRVEGGGGGGGGGEVTVKDIIFTFPHHHASFLDGALVNVLRRNPPVGCDHNDATPLPVLSA